MGQRERRRAGSLTRTCLVFPSSLQRKPDSHFLARPLERQGDSSFRWNDGAVQPLPCAARAPFGRDMTFETVTPLLREALAARGYSAPTPVQAQILEAEERDLIVSA